MSENATDHDEDQKPPTPEELKKQKEELNKFYGSQIPLLKKRAEYEELLTKIEVARMTRFEITMAKAQMMNPPEDPQAAGHQGPPQNPEDAGEHIIPVNEEKKPKKRKLKPVK